MRQERPGFGKAGLWPAPNTVVVGRAEELGGAERPAASYANDGEVRSGSPVARVATL